MDIKAQGGEALLADSAREVTRGATRGSRQNFELKESTAAGRDLSSYRRTAFPTNSLQLPVVAKGRAGSRVGGVSSFSETLFRRKAANNLGNNLGVGGGQGAIGVGQRAAALKQTGGILSERFVADNPLLAPAPAELPSLEALSAGGGVLGLPNGELGGGGLSADVLRALQKYRVAAEVQG